MKTIWYEQPDSFELRDVPVPIPREGEVRIKTAYAGVCGTDVHLHHGGFSPRYPFTPGHEIIGYVDELGPGVTEPPVGELVAIDNRIACGFCHYCRRALPAYCTKLRDLGVTDPGGVEECVIVPAGKCHGSGGLPPEVLAFAEPMACVMHGMDVLDMRPGGTALVIGAGTTGLLLAQALRRSGAASVTIAGPTRSKLDLALSYGVEHAIQVQRDASADLKSVLLADHPHGFDVVVDATGATTLQAAAIELVAISGTVLLYGMAPAGATIPLDTNDVFTRELTIKSSFTQAFSFQRGIDALVSGAVRTEGMLTHSFPIEEYAAALDAVVHDRECIKAVIKF